MVHRRRRGPSGRHAARLEYGKRLVRKHEEAFRQAAWQLQRARDGGRVRGEDIRQLLVRQFGVAYTLNDVYDLLKRLELA